MAWSTSDILAFLTLCVTILGHFQVFTMWRYFSTNRKPANLGSSSLPPQIGLRMLPLMFVHPPSARLGVQRIPRDIEAAWSRYDHASSMSRSESFRFDLTTSYAI